MKRINKRSITLVLVGFLSVMLLSCGQKEQEENISEEQVIQKYYYSIDETTLPDYTEYVQVPEGGIVYGGEALAFNGKQIYHHTITAAADYVSDVAFYHQILATNNGQWQNICIPGKPFVLDGIEFGGLNSLTVSSMNGELYTTAYTSEDLENYLCLLGPNGAEKVICKVPEEVQKEWNDRADAGIGGTILRDRDGDFYAYYEWKDTITCYDSTLQKKNTFTVPKYVYGMMQEAAGKDVYWYGCGLDNKPIVGNLTKDEFVLEGVDGIATDYLAEISSEGVLFLADTQNLWRVENRVPIKVFQFQQNGFIIRQLYGMEAGENGEILLLAQVDDDLLLLRLQETEVPQKKQEIVVAFAVQHPALNRSIARFNRQSKKYHISVTLPEEGENAADFSKRIQLELSTGKGPDILGYDIIENPLSYIENNYIECMDDVFADKSLYLEAALKASEVEGKLYGVPFECSFDVVAYDKEFVGERSHLTAEELIKAVRESDVEILQENFSGYRIVTKYALYDNSNTAYIDWEKGESYLEEQSFWDLLAFAKEYADTENIEKQAFAVSPKFSNMYELRDMKELFASFDGAAIVLGYPAKEGNGIYVHANQLYLNSNSACKEGAKEFLRFLISEKEQCKYVTYDPYQNMSDEEMAANVGYTLEFPVLLKAFDKLVELELKRDKENLIYTDNGVIQLDALYTEEMIEQFYFVLEHAKPADYYMLEIADIIYEELTPYFEGVTDAKEAAMKLDNRVQLYLDERVG